MRLALVLRASRGEIKSVTMPLSIANRAYRSARYRAAKLWGGAQKTEPVAAALKPHLLLNTMPKSGSVFLMHTLSESLRCGRIHLGNMYSLVDQISLDKMRLFFDGGYVSQNHLAPSVENLQILEHFGCRVVLHIRDPRQALVSWTHHVDRVHREKGAEALLLHAPRPSAGYFSWTFAEKLDWQIDHYWPLLIAWLTDWLALHDKGRLPILLTTYEELNRDAPGLCQRICDFCDVPRGEFRYVDLPRTIDYHFRLGDDGEWLHALSAAQIERVNATMPLELAIRFDWASPASLRGRQPSAVDDHGMIDAPRGEPRGAENYIVAGSLYSGSETCWPHAVP
ncbi:MAG TPA: sulfotransferase domain-containing protein [Stellaceae bacterium]|nr:sulfotransferase domain-containing protein [Stellaceae bacterium]